MATFSDLKVKDNKATFQIDGLDLSVVNCLRRIIQSEVPHLGIGFDPYAAENNDINILVNNTSLHNEFLGHRVSMLPIYLPPAEIITGFNPSKYKFVLKAENKGVTIQNVTTKDIRVYDENGDLYDEAFHRRVFPPFEPENNREYYPLIIRLKPNVTKPLEGQAVHIEFRTRLDIGKTHARWCPVSLCVFENVLDLEHVKLERAKISDAKELNRFDTLGKQRLFFKNEYGDPCCFLFKLESESSIGPCKLFDQGIDVLASKLDAVLATFSKIKTETLENGMNVFTFQEQEHVLGNLIQCMVYNAHSGSRGDGIVDYVGYYVPHPLKTEMVVKIKCDAEDANVPNLLLKVLRKTRSLIGDVKEAFAVFAKEQLNNVPEVYSKIKVDIKDDAKGALANTSSPIKTNHMESKPIKESKHLNVVSDSEISAEDEESEEEESKPKVVAKKAVAPAPKKKPVAKKVESEEEEDDAPAPKKKAVPKKKTVAKKVESDDEDEAPKKKTVAKVESDDEDEAPKKKVVAKKKAVAKVESDEEEEEVTTPPKKKVVAKKKAVAKVETDDEEEEEEEVATPPKKKAVAKKKVAKVESDDEDEAPKKKVVAKKKAVAKVETDDEEEEEKEEVVTPPKKKVMAKKKTVAKKVESDDEEEEEEIQKAPPAPKKKAVPKKAKIESDDDEEPAPKKPVNKSVRKKLVVSDSDEE